MTESSVAFESTGACLEGRLERIDPKSAAVISHPHPLYGGNMENPVVQTLQSAYRKNGYSTLRFNFRGVGRSGGNFDEGRGEGEDLAAACSYLESLGFSNIALTGYSFGAWVCARSAARLKPDHMILVAPPAAMMDFSTIPPLASLRMVVTGSRDAFAPPGLLAPLVKNWRQNAELIVIEGADHFFLAHLHELEEAVKKELFPGTAASGD